MAIFMKFGAVKGDVTSDGFKEWTELNSFQWGVGRGIASPVGRGTNREGSSASVSEITVSKQMDPASPDLFLDAVAGEMNTKVTISFTRTTKGKTETYLSYELTDTGLSGYSISSGGDRPSESLSLNFTKVIWSLTSFDAAGKGTPVKQGYDLSQEKTT